MSPRSPLSPFTAPMLANMRSKLIPTHLLPKPLPSHTVPFVKRKPVEAAVLIPLMNIDDRPHILMEVRGQGMRVHAGEVSFPGGKADDTDESLIHTALREAKEELALPPDNVEILGMLDPEYSLGNKSRVWPFVGFVHPTPPPWPTSLTPTGARRPDESLFSSSTTLPSHPLSALIPSPAEVSAILPLPLDALIDPSRHALHFFRLDTYRPYHRVKATDLVLRSSLTVEGGVGELEVWGLSGWFLNKLAERVGWLEMPPVPPSPED
ncbi:hypothetical protein CI109_106035 [Kwoniella shandongensis]|uniref:Uncharacterized protein n=1 Tax=Kwoniella shandongensis TaxID=1734106 RepID=A0A5M6BXT0_9TREE|nr:uncharacterized protein CI109_003916 [Kwoniella shandongensis]KAA5527657.1 hypothetical protein CI109_003916 [Kwoniella shandongensis]